MTWENIEDTGFKCLIPYVDGTASSFDRTKVNGGWIYKNMTVVVDNKLSIHVSESMCFVPEKELKNG